MVSRFLSVAVRFLFSHPVRMAKLILSLGSGIGKACALAFSQAGCQGVMIADINLENAEGVAAECKRVSTRLQFQAEVAHIDVTLESSVKEAIGHAVAKFKRIDHCVISAGVRLQSTPNPVNALVRLRAASLLV